MKQILARNISSFTANLLPPFLSTTSKLNPLHLSPLQSTLSSLSSLSNRRLFSSEIPKSPESNLGQSQNEDDAEKLNNNQELKQQIEKFYDGDQDAFESIFEAILMRKLSGKTDEIDEELMKELPNQPRVDDDEDSDDKEFDSD